MRACRARPERRGLTSVAVLVCLVIITMVSGALLKVGSPIATQVRSRRSTSSRPNGWPSRASIAQSPGSRPSRTTRARPGS